MTAGEPPPRPGLWTRRGWRTAAALLALLLMIGVGLVVLWVQTPPLYETGDAAKTAGAPGPSALIAGQAGGTSKTLRLLDQ